MAEERPPQARPLLTGNNADQDFTRFALFLKVTQAINEAADYQSAIGVVLRKICMATAWDFGEAWVPRDDGTMLVCGPEWYQSTESLTPFRRRSEHLALPPGVGQPGRVWLSKRPEWIEDMSLRTSSPRAEIAKRVGLKATLGVPVIARGNVIAVLTFAMREARTESKRMVEIVSAVATQLGSFIERKQAEEALRESERRFRAIFNQTFQFIGLLTPEGKVIEVNQAALAFRKLRRSDVIGRFFWQTPWWDISAAARERLKAAIANAASGKFIRYEAEHLRADGTIATVDFSLKPITDENGRVVLIIPEGRDISERKRAQRALEESETVLRAIMDTSTSVIFLKNPAGRYLLVNHQYELLFHITGEQIRGKTDHDLFPREVADALRANDLKVIEAGAPLEFEEVVVQDDGMHTYIANKFPLFDSAGKLYAVCGIATDITERKLAEEHDVLERKKAETWLESLISTTQDAVISIDRRGGIVLFNPSAERMFGYTKTEIRGRKIGSLMTEPYASEHERYIARYEQTGEGRVLGRIRTVAARRKNGEIFPAELSVTEVTTHGDVRYAAFIRDVSEKTRLQEQLLESERLAAISTTAAKLAHEIGNPLNGMYMTAQLLERRLAKQKDSQDAMARSTVQSLMDEIKRLNDILQEFRSLSRREKYNFRPTRLCAVAEELLEMEGSRYRALGIRVEQKISRDLPLIDADGEKLKQALLNLCNNAVEAMPHGGTLTLQAHRSEDRVVLGVADTGLGVPADVDIFEPFATTKKWGTGLGLVIARQIVTSHGGTITYTSERGKGTLFRLSLPLRQPPRERLTVGF